jgi:hypothetical protein
MGIRCRGRNDDGGKEIEISNLRGYAMAAHCLFWKHFPLPLILFISAPTRTRWPFESPGDSLFPSVHVHARSWPPGSEWGDNENRLKKRLARAISKFGASGVLGQDSHKCANSIFLFKKKDVKSK